MCIITSPPPKRMRERPPSAACRPHTSQTPSQDVPWFAGAAHRGSERVSRAPLVPCCPPTLCLVLARSGPVGRGGRPRGRGEHIKYRLRPLLSPCSPEPLWIATICMAVEEQVDVCSRARRPSIGTEWVRGPTQISKRVVCCRAAVVEGVQKWRASQCFQAGTKSDPLMGGLKTWLSRHARSHSAVRGLDHHGEDGT